MKTQKLCESAIHSGNVDTPQDKPEHIAIGKLSAEEEVDKKRSWFQRESNNNVSR